VGRWRLGHSLQDIFELQDKVAVNVAGIIEPTLVSAELHRSARSPTDDITAYDLFLRALAASRLWEKEGILRAVNLCAQALERDCYAPALGLASHLGLQIHLNGWTNDPETTRREALDFTQRALRHAGGDPWVLGRCAYVLGYFGEDIVVALTTIDHALELNPSFALGWMWSGWLRSWAGQPDVAIEHFETSIRLSPRESRANVHLGIGVSHFLAHRFEEAMTMLLLSLHEKPTWAPTHRFIASCYAQMGRLDEARATIERLRDIAPSVIPKAEHWRVPEQRAFFLEGLRLAAGEMK
jgi:adenylate cyclase